ncbi:MAG: hypothetical protein ACLFVP_07185 [Candidatus Bathyarchaeia archaeon]
MSSNLIDKIRDFSYYGYTLPMLLILRQTREADSSYVTDRLGVESYHDVGNAIEQMTQLSLVDRRIDDSGETYLRLTKKGRRVANKVQELARTL